MAKKTKIQLLTKTSTEEENPISDVELDLGEPLFDKNSGILYVGTGDSNDGPSNEKTSIGSSKTIFEQDAENIHLKTLREDGEVLSNYILQGEGGTELTLEKNTDTTGTCRIRTEAPIIDTTLWGGFVTFEYIEDNDNIDWNDGYVIANIKYASDRSEEYIAGKKGITKFYISDSDSEDPTALENGKSLVDAADLTDFDFPASITFDFSRVANVHCTLNGIEYSLSSENDIITLYGRPSNCVNIRTKNSQPSVALQGGSGISIGLESVNLDDTQKVTTIGLEDWDKILYVEDFTNGELKTYTRPKYTAPQES